MYFIKVYFNGGKGCLDKLYDSSISSYLESVASWSFLCALEVLLVSITHGQGQIFKCEKSLKIGIVAIYYFF